MTTAKAKKATKLKHKEKVQKRRRGWIRLLDFSTSTCVPCKEMSKILDQFAPRNPDIRVERLILDKEHMGHDAVILGEEVQAVPTLVFLRKKKVLRRIQGVVGLRALENAAVKARAAAE